ncbi:MAG TPA: hypothetical protein VFA10_06870 [Ktedonobacteraceae bacterium]|nr:hypothetical protein [Ktedonobacteraceae bacterium]
MMYKQRVRLLIGVLLILMSLVTVAACAQSSAGNSPRPIGRPSVPAITIKAMNYSYDQPQTVSAGMVDITLVNNGTEPHQDNIVRLHDGVTFAQFQAALLKQGDLGAVELGTFYGGPNAILPGKSQEVILNLPAGHYVSVCFVRGSDNVPHYMKGMLTQFTVVGSPGESQIPRADGEIVLQNFSYVLPGTLPSGPITLKVTSRGSQTHEVTLVQLAPGKSMQDVIAFLQHPAGPPPFELAGGLAAIAPQESAWLKLNLQPGKYGTLCFVTDPTTGKPHFMLGMIAQFTVQ